MTKPPVNHWPDCIFVKINFVSGLACAAATTRCKSTPDKDMTRWSQLKRKIGVSSELDWGLQDRNSSGTVRLLTGGQRLGLQHNWTLIDWLTLLSSLIINNCGWTLIGQGFYSSSGLVKAQSNPENCCERMRVGGVTNTDWGLRCRIVLLFISPAPKLSRNIDISQKKTKIFVSLLRWSPNSPLQLVFVGSLDLWNEVEGGMVWRQQRAGWLIPGWLGLGYPALCSLHTTHHILLSQLQI